MILIHKVTKKYKDKTVLNNISFTIEGGEMVSIVGRSGAGKTTLMYAMIGAEPINEGEIRVDDYIVTNLKSSEVQEYRRKIGIVFQDYKLLPKKTVFENVAFALEVEGYSENFINERTRDILKLTGLEDQRNHFPRELSAGEKQRTAIARAIVHAPELLFADEPTGNLDPENSIALAKLFEKINKCGTTIVLATHNKDVVNTLKRRVIKLDNGKVVSDKENSEYN